ncbi:putative quinol monooxygenase [Nocardioides donggukensis]|uniref:Antibiotic biosynthesis monooxygenase n=1 Tax=Nocardioides donggukensis TaxID=2774019 RepID=A0A927K5D9_9ACTN|nr:putative quinol monooxygenase [Nocardioides donggukensis]MBD8868181.1 antibiotic biosynthesis monooxygenase [Nocardioides donggukensis]
MSQLHVVATIPARSGSEAVIREALTTLVAATRDEEGCLSYDLYESAAAPGTFVTVERWSGQEALDAHMATPHVGAAFAAAADHLGGEVAIHPLAPVS